MAYIVMAYIFMAYIVMARRTGWAAEAGRESRIGKARYGWGRLARKRNKDVARVKSAHPPRPGPNPNPDDPLLRNAMPIA